MAERHAELMKDRERLERMRAGRTTAALMNLLGSKKDETAFAEWDVFPELKPEEEPDTDYARLRMMMREMAARQNARVQMGEAN